MVAASYRCPHSLKSIGLIWGSAAPQRRSVCIHQNQMPLRHDNVQHHKYHLGYYYYYYYC